MTKVRVMENKVENVAYDGHCAFAVSTGKTDVKGGNHKLIKEGRTFLFSNVIAKFLFNLLPNRIKKADEAWSKK